MNWRRETDVAVLEAVRLDQLGCALSPAVRTAVLMQDSVRQSREGLSAVLSHYHQVHPLVACLKRWDGSVAVCGALLLPYQTSLRAGESMRGRRADRELATRDLSAKRAQPVLLPPGRFTWLNQMNHQRGRTGCT